MIYLQDLRGTAVDSAETTGLRKLFRSEPGSGPLASGMVSQLVTGTLQMTVRQRSIQLREIEDPQGKRARKEIVWSWKDDLRIK